jgi:hypothetical protein
MNFVTGNKFKNISDFILDEKGFVKTINNNIIPIFFVKTDFIDLFFSNYAPSYSFKLITHNSDFPINYHHLKYLENENLISWFAQNVNFKHKKLFSIPIGIANEIWQHGDESVILDVMNTEFKKNNLIYCNFDVRTNFFERNKCIQWMSNNSLDNSERKEFKIYLQELKNSFFCLSPNGNGIDCHKTWESMYLKTIPIVTKSINIDFYKDYPIFLIDSWEEFNFKEITIDLYKKIINDYSSEKLNFDFFRKKILEIN